MKCPTCGAAGYGGNEASEITKKVTTSGSKLKNLVMKRPNAPSKR